MQLKLFNWLLIAGSCIRGIQTIDIKSQDIADTKATRSIFKKDKNISVNRSIDKARVGAQTLSRRGYLDGYFIYENRPECAHAVTEDDFEKVKGIVLPQLESQILGQFHKYLFGGTFEISIDGNEMVWGIEKYFLDIEVFKIEFEAKAIEIAKSYKIKFSLSWKPFDKPLDMKSLMERHYEKFMSENKLNFGSLSMFMKEKIISTLEEIKRSQIDYIVNWDSFRDINTLQNSNEVKKLIEKMIVDFIKTLALKIKVSFINEKTAFKKAEPIRIKNTVIDKKHENFGSKFESKSSSKVILYTINELNTKLDDLFIIMYFYFSRQAFFEILQTIFYNAQVNPGYVINLNRFIPYFYEHAKPAFNQILKNEITIILKTLNISYTPKFIDLDTQKTGFSFKQYLKNQQRIFFIKDFEKFESKVNFTITELAKHPIIDLKEWLNFVQNDYRFEFSLWLKKHITIMAMMYHRRPELSFKPLDIKPVTRVRRGTLNDEINEKIIREYIRKIDLAALNQKEQDLFKKEFIQVTNKIIESHSKRIFDVGFGNDIVTISPKKGFKLMASHVKTFIKKHQPGLKFNLKRMKVQSLKYNLDEEISNLFI